MSCRLLTIYFIKRKCNVTGSYSTLSHNRGFRLKQSQSKVFKLTCLATCLTAALSLVGCDSNNAREPSTKQITELVSAVQNADYVLPHSVFEKYSVDGVLVIETEENKKTLRISLSFLSLKMCICLRLRLMCVKLTRLSNSTIIILHLM